MNDKIITIEARRIVATGGACCANCVYSAPPASLNPYRPALKCTWFEFFSKLPKPWKIDRVALPLEVEPHMENCAAWEKGDAKP